MTSPSATSIWPSVRWHWHNSAPCASRRWKKKSWWMSDWRRRRKPVSLNLYGLQGHVDNFVGVVHALDEANFISARLQQEASGIHQIMSPVTVVIDGPSGELPAPGELGGQRGINTDNLHRAHVVLIALDYLNIEDGCSIFIQACLERIAGGHVTAASVELLHFRQVFLKIYRIRRLARTQLHQFPQFRFANRRVAVKGRASKPVLISFDHRNGYLNGRRLSSSRLQGDIRITKRDF